MSEETLERRAEHANEGGSKGIALVVAGTIVTFCIVLPFVSLLVLYLFMTVYAIVRSIGPGAGENPVPIVLGFVLITSVLTLLLGVTIDLVGRSLTPRKRRSRD